MQAPVGHQQGRAGSFRLLLYLLLAPTREASGLATA